MHFPEINPTEMKFLAYGNFQAKKNQSERKLTILARGIPLGQAEHLPCVFPPSPACPLPGCLGSTHRKQTCFQGLPPSLPAASMES